MFTLFIVILILAWLLAGKFSVALSTDPLEEKIRLLGKKSLLQPEHRPEMVVVDVTEFPIERPKRRQNQFYSGKKKRHTSNPSWWSIYHPCDCLHGTWQAPSCG